MVADAPTASVRMRPGLHRYGIECLKQIIADKRATGKHPNSIDEIGPLGLRSERPKTKSGEMENCGCPTKLVQYRRFRIGLERAYRPGALVRILCLVYHALVVTQRSCSHVRSGELNKVRSNTTSSAFARFQWLPSRVAARSITVEAIECTGSVSTSESSSAPRVLKRT